MTSSEMPSTPRSQPELLDSCDIYVKVLRLAVLGVMETLMCLQFTMCASLLLNNSPASNTDVSLAHLQEIKHSTQQRPFFLGNLHLQLVRKEAACKTFLSYVTCRSVYF